MLSKGLNRAMGTITGGLLGCLAATLAEQIGGTGEAIAVGISIFIFGESNCKVTNSKPNQLKIFSY